MPLAPTAQRHGGRVVGSGHENQYVFRRKAGQLTPGRRIERYFEEDHLFCLLSHQDARALDNASIAQPVGALNGSA